MTKNKNGSRAPIIARRIMFGGIIAGIAMVIGYFHLCGYGIYFDDIDLRPHLKWTNVYTKPGSNGDTETVSSTMRFGPSGNPEAFPQEIKIKKNQGNNLSATSRK